MATMSPRYKADDGKEFKTEVEADKHSLGLKLGPQLDEYLNSLTLKATTDKGVILSKARLRKNLLAFLFWQSKRPQA